jgi:SAM-dependent methyltransferase
MTDPTKPFDLQRKVMQRARAARGFAVHAFLHQRACADLADRLEAVNRRFARTLVIGDGGLFGDEIDSRPALRDKLGAITRADFAPGYNADVILDSSVFGLRAQAFDVILSVLHLHWANDLPGALIQLRQALRPDGLFLGALFGAETLQELRACLLAAETEVTGGAGPRISPFADALDIAGLLQRAGFALPVADVDRISVRYAEPLRLLADVRGMGESAALADPAPPLRRAVLARALDLYRARFADPDGKCRASFTLLTATGWAPHESQQKPLRPGSAKARLAEALGVTEQSAGEKAGG